MTYKALMVGNSDGIGLATTKRLLAGNWDIIGISKSESPITNKAYHHHVADVRHSNYTASLNELLSEGPVDLCIYFAGIGELLNPLDMSHEPEVIDVNLTGMVKTASKVIWNIVLKKAGLLHCTETCHCAYQVSKTNDETWCQLVFSGIKGGFYIFRRYLPPTSYSALVICPKLQ